MKSTEWGQEDFLMLHRADLSQLKPLLQARQLLPRDITVLVMLMSHVNWRSGRARVTATFLAEEIGMQRTHVTSSIGRLRKEMLVARVREPASGDVYFLLNPYLVSVGGPERRNLLWAQFQASLE